MSGPAKTDRLAVLVQSGHIQTFDRSLKKAASALVRNPSSTREERQRFAEALLVSGRETARHYLQAKAKA